MKPDGFSSIVDTHSPLIYLPTRVSALLILIKLLTSLD